MKKIATVAIAIAIITAGYQLHRTYLKQSLDTCLKIQEHRTTKDMKCQEIANELNQ